MFDDSFYPTPDEVIDEMLAPYRREYDGKYMTIWTLPFRQILEPSAGKGNIADRLVARYEIRKDMIYCIERSMDLRRIVLDKGYKVIGVDWLEYQDNLTFDLIVMNPPFDDGASHLLKAWDVMRNGHIVCLLNAETVNNPYTKERQLLKTIIDAFGDVKYIGKAFKDSERPTDVEVVIVWLEKQTASENIDFGVEGMQFDARVDEPTFQANPLAHADILESLVAQYNHAAEIMKQMHALERQMRFFTQEVRSVRYGDSKDARKITADSDKHEDDKAPETLNEKLMELKEQFWNYVFTKTKIGSVTTSEFQRTWRENVKHASQLAFTRDNIMHVFEIFLENRDEIIKKCIVSVFDTATSYHEKNRVHTEGWKTNKQWKLAGKVIIPRGLTYDNGFRFYRGRDSEFYDDMDKALCFITGRSMDKDKDPSFVSISAAIERHIDSYRYKGMDYADIFESTFFYIRIYKKGTVHLMFQDADLCARFNIAAADGKGWLGTG